MIKLFFLFFTLNTFANSDTLDLISLLKNIELQKSMKVNFVETSNAFFLSEPTISKGILEFKKPTTLIKNIHTPEQSLILIKDNILFINGEEKLDLNEQPILAMPINTIIWLLNGNFIQLTNNFYIQYINNNQKWKIELTPKVPEILAEIEKITIFGNKEFIDDINILKANGDTINTKLSL
jgi:hypothetical protein